MKFLLDYLETKYKISESLANYAKEVLEQLEKGSICVKINNAADIEELKKSNAVGTNYETNMRPLFFDGENLYIQRYFAYQKMILERIKELRENKKIHIITGGPGTGKTTSLCDILKNKLSKKILLAAPTGKAAFRMKESLFNNEIKLEAKTLHRLLGYNHLSVNFKHTRENPLEADIIAIDECSMVDLPMMAKLLNAIPANCDLYLLGDKNQLASVEAGSVFADICRKFKNDEENVYKELVKNYRAGEAPGIVALSEQILNKTIESFDNENVHSFENAQLEEKLFCRYKNLFSAASKEEALEFLKTFQILCATRVGKNGTEHINNNLRIFAKKEKAKWQPIIITENNYQQNLFNGDVGIEFREKQEAYFYAGKNEIKTFSALTLPKHEPAFAITIHKSQGSEYETVAVIYPERENDGKAFLTKELLYTAITRARKECLIFGNKELLANSCKKEIYRASGIK